jgi:hypothetical protein
MSLSSSIVRGRSSESWAGGDDGAPARDPARPRRAARDSRPGEVRGRTRSGAGREAGGRGGGARRSRREEARRASRERHPLAVRHGPRRRLQRARAPGEACPATRRPSARRRRVGRQRTPSSCRSGSQSRPGAIRPASSASTSATTSRTQWRRQRPSRPSIAEAGREVTLPARSRHPRVTDPARPFRKGRPSPQGGARLRSGSVVVSQGAGA